MKIALAQINPIVGDLSGNTKKIIDYIKRAKNEKADLVVFPELALTGYPPEDLLLKKQFIDDNLAYLKKIISNSIDIAVCVGFVDRINKDLFNAAAFIEGGKLKNVYHKMNLPNYSIFDEKRYFKEGKNISVVNFKGNKICLCICEDLWVDRKYPKDIDFILSINASPYNIGKIRTRQKVLKSAAHNAKTEIIYVNMVGGQDELVFDGGSMIVDSKDKIKAAFPQFVEELFVFETDKSYKTETCLSETSEVYTALVLGVRDYVNKNGFSEVVIGLSGGIDSALTLAIAADALDASRVHVVYMPSNYSSEQSLNDAKTISKNIGIDLVVIPISEILASFLTRLNPYFDNLPANVAEENLQARIRGNILMALSNKFGWLVLTTGNKSEMAVGYATLYGDMAGGFAVIKDVPKTLVYKLADYKRDVIPESIIIREPTAELRPNQKDTDSLPPYDILDPILSAYVEEDKSISDIVSLGFDEKIVRKVIRMVDLSEYKRRQSAPGIRITPKAFGKDRRLPITNKYR